MAVRLHREKGRSSTHNNSKPTKIVIRFKRIRFKWLTFSRLFRLFARKPGKGTVNGTISSPKVPDHARGGKTSGRKTSPSVLSMLRPSTFTPEACAEFCTAAGRFIILLAVLLLPLVYSSKISSTGEFPKYIGLLSVSILIGTLFILSVIAPKKFTFSQSPLVSLIIAFLLGNIISAIFSIHPIATIFGNRGTWATSIVGITSACILAISISNMFQKEKFAYRLLVYLAISGFFMSLLYLFSRFLLPALGFDGDLASFLPISDMNNLSAFLLITLTATIAIVLDPAARHLRILSGLVAVAQIVSLIMTQAYLPLTIGFFTIVLTASFLFSRNESPRTKVLGIFLLRKRLRRLEIRCFASDSRFIRGLKALGIRSCESNRKLHTVVLSGTLCAAFILILFLIPATATHLPESISQSSYIQTCRTTISSWKAGFTIFSNHPLVGTGPELLNTELLKESASFTRELINSSLAPFSFSSGIVTLLATTGLVGTLPIVLIVLYLLSKITSSARSNIYRSSEMLNSSYLSRAYLLGTTVFAVSLFTVPLTALTVFAGFVVLGVGSAHIAPAVTVTRSHSPTKALSYLFVIVFAAYLFYSVFTYTRAEFLYMKSTTETSPTNLNLITDAIGDNQYDAAYHRARAGYLVQYLHTNSQNSNASETVRQIRQSVDTALVINPYDYLNLYVAAQAYSDLAGILDNTTYLASSTSYASSAIEQSPHDPRLYLFRGTVFLQMNNSAAALTDFETALSISPDYWPSYLYAAQVLINLEQYDKAHTYLTTVVEESNNAQYFAIARSMLEKIQETGAE